MAVSVEIHHTGSDPGERADIAAHIEHALADKRGDWKVSIIGSQASDHWEMKILGPNGFERTYMLEGRAGKTEPQAIGRIVAKVVPKGPGRPIEPSPDLLGPEILRVRLAYKNSHAACSP